MSTFRHGRKKATVWMTALSLWLVLLVRLWASAQPTLEAVATAISKQHQQPQQQQQQPKTPTITNLQQTAEQQVGGGMYNIRVSYRGFDDAPCAEYTGAAVELQNRHATQTMYVEHITTTAEEVSWIHPVTKQRQYEGTVRYQDSNQQQNNNNNNVNQQQQGGGASSPSFNRITFTDHPIQEEIEKYASVAAAAAPPKQREDESSSTTTTQSNNNSTTIPQQVFVTWDFNNQEPQHQVAIPPNQGIVIPLKILPRFPTLHEAHNLWMALLDNNNNNGRKKRRSRRQRRQDATNNNATTNSIYEETDWDNWEAFNARLEEEASSTITTTTTATATASETETGTTTTTTGKRSNYRAILDEWMFVRSPDYRVRCKLLVQTNFGSVHVDLNIETALQSDVGLPSAITFPKAITSDSDDDIVGSSSSSSTSRDRSKANAENFKHNRTSVEIVSSRIPLLHGDTSQDVLSSVSRFGSTNTKSTTTTTSTIKPSSKENDDDCFDLYIRNPETRPFLRETRSQQKYGGTQFPSQHQQQYTAGGSKPQDLSITTILTTKPHLVTIQVDAEKDTISGSGVRKNQGPTAMVTQLTTQNNGDLSLSASSESRTPQYVATVCPVYGSSRSSHRRRKVDATDNAEYHDLLEKIDIKDYPGSMGYIALRTNTDQMYLVAVEEESPNAPLLASQQHAAVVNIGFPQEQWMNTLINTFRSKTAPIEVKNAMFEQVKGQIEGQAEIQVQLDNMSKSALLGDIHEEEEDEQARVAVTAEHLQAYPNQINLIYSRPAHDATKNASFAELSIELQNTGRDEITVLRTSMAVQKPNDYMAEAVSFDIRPLSTALSEPIPGNSRVVDAIQVQSSVDWTKYPLRKRENSLIIDAMILVRATTERFDKDKDSDEYLTWIASFTNDSRWGDSFVLEIPMKVFILPRRLGVFIQGTSHPFPLLVQTGYWTEDLPTVESAFFPMNQFLTTGVVSSSDSEFLNLETKSIDHHFRVFSGIPHEMKLSRVEILDEEKSRISKFGAYKDSLCSRFEASLGGKPPHPFDIPDEQDVGLIHLRYRFPPTSPFDQGKSGEKHVKAILPTVCYLGIETVPDSGKHLMPLVVYGGEVDLAGSQFESSIMAPAKEWNVSVEESSGWYRAIVGFDKLVDWFHSTKTGAALQSVLVSSALNKGSSSLTRDGESILLGRYLYSLSRRSIDLENSKLRPVLLKVGAIEQGQVETLPLYFTNHNPVPLRVSIDVSEVDGVAISLGRDETTGSGDGNTPLDYLPQQGGSSLQPRINYGRFRGHPINGLRQFLLRDDRISHKYWSKFPFRDAVSASRLAMGRLPLLESLYQAHSLGSFHRTPKPDRPPSGPCDQTEYPALYGSFGRAFTERNIPGPVIVSIDGVKNSALRTCSKTRSESSHTHAFIPPGGVARFDISLRSPDGSLLDRDITEFLSTGLVLSTNHGEVIPIFVWFEALKGRLEMSRSPVPNTGREDNVISVPLGLFARNSPLRFNQTEETGFASDRDAFLSLDTADSLDGVPLFMRSSFSRDIQVKKIASCNPLFAFKALRANLGVDYAPTLGINIGTIRSAVVCEDDGESESLFPSFFRCALTWLYHRSELQPRGCGFVPVKEPESDAQFKETVASEKGGNIDYAIQALRDVLELSMDRGRFSSVAGKIGSSFGQGMKSGQRSFDGLPALPLLKAVAYVWDAWKVVSSSGLQSISTSLRAIVEYNSTADEIPAHNPGLAMKNEGGERHVLSVAIRNVTVESVLEVPILFDAEKARRVFPAAVKGDDASPSFLELAPTHVGEVMSIMIPLRNPTAVPVRVRLTVPPAGTDNEGHSPELSDPKVSKFLGGFRPPCVQRRHGISGDSALVLDTANEIWWGPEGGYFHADFHGDVIRSHQNTTIKAGSGAMFSLINPSVMFNTAFLVGCGSRCGIPEQGGAKKAPFVQGLVDLTPTSPIGASAGAGNLLIGSKRFSLAEGNHMNTISSFSAGGSLASGGNGPSAFALPFSALDEIVLPPYGEAEFGPVLFRPPGRSGKTGCALFTGSKMPRHCRNRFFETMVLLENSLSGVERVVLRGPTQWERLVFLDPDSPDGDAFGDIEVRNGRSTLVFPGTSDISGGHVGPVVKEILLHNAGDTVVNVNNISLFPSDKARKESLYSCRLGEFSLFGCEAAGKVSFKLQPGESYSVHVQHHPQCAKRKATVELVVGLEQNASASGSFRRNYLELDVGYDMSSFDFKSCVPTTVGVTSTIEKKKQRVRTGTRIAQKVARTVRLMFVFLAKLVCVLFIVTRLCDALGALQNDSRKFNIFLKRGDVKDQPASSTQMGINWSAAFRCLARVDPAPQDLRSLGREQTRQIMLLRYRTIGSSPPQVIVNGGVLSRERPVFGANSGTPRNLPGGRVASTSGNERMRTLSDALFGRFRQFSTSETGVTPGTLGWRVAASRGIINSESIDTSPLVFATKELLDNRSLPSSSIGNESDELTGDENGEQEEQSTEDSEFQIKGEAREGRDLPRSDVETSVEVTSERPPQAVELAKVSIKSEESVGESRRGRASESKEAAAIAISKAPAPEESSEDAAQGLATKSKQMSEERADKRSSEGTEQPAKKPANRQRATVSSHSADTEGKPEQKESPARIVPKDEAKQQSEKDERKAKERISGEKKRSQKEPKAKKGGEKLKEKKAPKIKSATESKIKSRRLVSPSTPPKPASGVILRPPPGLAPPPGFGDSAETFVPGVPAGQSSSAFNTAMHFPTTSYGRPAVVDLGRTISAASQTSTDNASFALAHQPPDSSPALLPTIPPLQVSESVPSQLPSTPARTLNESEGIEGFDLITFLDDILNEGSMSVDEEAQIREVRPGSARSGNIPIAPAVSENPWATTADSYHQSRAAAYGISIEEVGGGASPSSSHTRGHVEPIAGVPLLTPEAILSASYIAPREGGGETEDDSDKKALSFYASLLDD